MGSKMAAAADVHKSLGRNLLSVSAASSDDGLGCRPQRQRAGLSAEAPAGRISQGRSL